MGALEDWKQISQGFQDISGDESHVLSVKKDGTLWGWGLNGFGSIGDGTTVSRSSPVQIGALTDWSKCYAGKYHSLAIRTNGTAWVWGDNTQGQLAQGDDGFLTNRSSPTQIGSDTDWLDGDCGDYHIVLRKTNGDVYTCGDGNQGTLAQGDNIDRSSPVQIGGKWGGVWAGQIHTILLGSSSSSSTSSS